jgi:hypothetical protein
VSRKWKPNDVPRLVILFAGREGDLSQAIRGRVETLREKKAEPLFPGREQMVALKALQQLLAETRPPGSRFTAEQVGAWVRKELTEDPPESLGSLKELCLEVFGPLTSTRSSPKQTVPRLAAVST